MHPHSLLILLLAALSAHADSTGGPCGTTAANRDITGMWLANTGETIAIAQSGNTATVTFVNTLQLFNELFDTLPGTFDGTNLHFALAYNFVGTRFHGSGTVDMTLTVDGNTLAGTAQGTDQDGKPYNNNISWVRQTGTATLLPSSVQLQGAEGGKPVTDFSLTLYNCGGGPLTWQATATATTGNWLTLDPSNSTSPLAPGSAVTIGIDATPGTLKAKDGPFNGTVTVTAANAGASTAAVVFTLGTDQLDLSVPFPILGEVILDNPDRKTTAFFSVILYSLASQKNGSIFLRVTDANGNTLANGPAQPTVQGTDETVVAYVEAATYPAGSTSVSLTGVLIDSAGNVLAKSSPVAYQIVKPTFKLFVGRVDSSGNFGAPARLVIPSGISLAPGVTHIRVEYTYPGPPANLSLQVSKLTNAGGSQIALAGPAAISGTGTVLIPVGSIVPPVDSVGLTIIPALVSSSGQTVIYTNDAGTLPLTNVTLDDGFGPPEPNLTLDKSTGFVYSFSSNTPFLRVNFIGPPGLNPPSVSIQGGKFATLSFSSTLPSPASSPATFKFTWSSDSGEVPIATVSYSNLTKSGTIATGSGQSANLGSASITDATNTGNPWNGDVELTSHPFTFFISPPGGTTRREPLASPAHASSALPDFVGIHQVWHFSPPIPADGSFTANLTLKYSSDSLPDDPNFDETKLQIASFDPSTGTFATYPTALDLTNKTATTPIKGLAPYYSLVVLGPFSKSLLNLTTLALDSGFDTQLALVNTGASSTHLNFRGFAGDGTPFAGSPAASTLASNAQLFSSAAKLGFDPGFLGSGGWVQTPTDSEAVNGVAIIGNGKVLDALPLASGHAQTALLTDIELDATYSTEIHIVNPDTDLRHLTLTLFASDGSTKGTYTGSLPAKGTLIHRTEELFPGLASPFAGYLLIAGDGDIAASALLHSFATLSAANAHPVSPSASGAVTLYGPQLGASGQFTRVILVNAGKKSANLTFTGYRQDGTALGQPVTQTLSAGNQLIADLSQLFGYNAAAPPAGFFTVSSDQPQVFGDLTFGDSSFKQTSRAIIPLADTLLTSAILPYLLNDATGTTSVSVANPNSSAAAVTIAVYKSDGTLVGKGLLPVPANGFVSTTLTQAVAAASGLSTGYITLGSSQPVVAFATITPASQPDFAAFPASAIASAATGGSSSIPQINAGGVGNAAHFAPKLARGSLASLFGLNFVPGSLAALADSLPLPLAMAGVSVTVGGVRAPLLFVNANQINFQVPFEVPAGSSAAVIVTVNGIATPAVSVQMADYAVGVFTYARTSSTQDPIIVHGADNSLVTPSKPAVPNETLVVYATGVGKLNNPVSSGQGSPTSPPAVAADTPTITVGGSKAKVSFAGLTPGSVGLAQFNIQLPASLPSGNLPLVIQFPGDSSPAVNLAVKGNI